MRSCQSSRMRTRRQPDLQELVRTPPKHLVRFAGSVPAGLLARGSGAFRPLPGPKTSGMDGELAAYSCEGSFGFGP